MLSRVAPSSPLAWFIAMLMLLVGILGESALSLFVPRFQFLVLAAMLAACLASFAFVKCIQFYFTGFSGSGKGKRSGNGGRFLWCFSDRFCPQVGCCLCDRSSSFNVRALRVQEALDSASVYVFSSVKKRGCTVGLAMVRFLETFFRSMRGLSSSRVLRPCCSLLCTWAWVEVFLTLPCSLSGTAILCLSCFWVPQQELQQLRWF